MIYQSFSDFQAHAARLGFDEVLERVWAPNKVVQEHTHPFDVHAVVVSGSYHLILNGVSKEFNAGDTFELSRNVPHSERYGPKGCVFWVARRN